MVRGLRPSRLDGNLNLGSGLSIGVHYGDHYKNNLLASEFVFSSVAELLIPGDLLDGGDK